jgi:hypothetical protein
MARYSVSAAKALGFLKRPYNDVEIYVEDMTCHYMYVLFFRRILPAPTRLVSVNQIGDRRSVIQACRRDQINDGRKRIYIIDGDFDHYHNKKRPRIKHLYRLRAYCVENLIFHEIAAIAVAARADTNTPENVITRQLDFTRWNEEITRKLMPLFIVYSIAEAFGSGVPTVSFAVERLLVGRDLSQERIRQRMAEVARDVCRARGFPAYKQMRQSIQRNLGRARIPADHLISGKSYLLPLLHKRLREQFGYRGNADQLRTELAENYDAALEPRLRRRLLDVVSGI